jgi:hypothetical protein
MNSFTAENVMPRFSSKLFVSSIVEPELPSPFQDRDGMIFDLQFAAPDLNALVLKVSRKPSDLLAHLRRIYFCYENALSEPLYAALLDLSIVLDDKGHDLRCRLLAGCRSKLDEQQLLALNVVCHGLQNIQGNQFSLFTKGLIGKTQLLKVGKPEQAQQDALILAKDYIEYSQLEQAMSTLEQAIEIEPDREDIQLLLLELYQSTRSVERFQNQFHAITQRGALKIEDWQALADVFNEKSV